MNQIWIPFVVKMDSFRNNVVAYNTFCGGGNCDKTLQGSGIEIFHGLSFCHSDHSNQICKPSCFFAHGRCDDGADNHVVVGFGLCHANLVEFLFVHAVIALYRASLLGFLSASLAPTKG